MLVRFWRWRCTLLYCKIENDGLQKIFEIIPFHVIRRVTSATHVFLQVVLAMKNYFLQWESFLGSELALYYFGLVLSSS